MAQDNKDTSQKSAAGFDQLGLSEVMLAALQDADYQIPSPVQAGIIPYALTGKDVMGQARTGTGKTAAFAIPILESLNVSRKGRKPRALVLVPTRELAVQVRDEIIKLSKGRKTRCVAVYGGKPIRTQINHLTRGCDIIVGTPGRVLDHLSRESLQLEDLQCVVLDEADRMLDIGFRPDIEKILRRCPKQRQTLLLSATLDKGVERLAKRYMVEPEVMNFSPTSKAADTIEQHYFTVEESLKYDLLLKLIDRENPEQAIVFCRTKRGTDRLERKLSQKLEKIACIHGDMQQRVRDRVMRSFREGKIRILVATDVVGRGIDVSGISHIINYDLPQSSDDYVHRVGRTGRMGREGVAYSFVTPEQGTELTRIEMLINTLLKRDEIDGFQTVAQAAPPQTAEDKSEKPKPAPPGQRPRRRHRRAL